MISTVIPYGVKPKSAVDLAKESFEALIDVANQPTSTFEKASMQFSLLKSCWFHRFDFDVMIEESKGNQFFKVLEIKAQHADFFVPLKTCKFDKASTDGFVRKVDICVTDAPQIEERLYIKKNPNGDMQVIFVQNDKQDLFACLNSVSQQGGKWHWSGCYLYGELSESKEKEEQSKKQMFDATYTKMLNFMDRQDFELIYQQLERW